MLLSPTCMHNGLACGCMQRLVFTFIFQSQVRTTYICMCHMLMPYHLIDLFFYKGIGIYIQCHKHIYLFFYILSFYFNFSPMELGSITDFLQNKNILVIGATGFLAKSASLFLSLFGSLIIFSCTCIIYMYS